MGGARKLETYNPKIRFSLFDLDGTLTRGDTFTGFIRHVHGLWGLVRVLAVSAPMILLWKLGMRTNVDAKLRMFAAAFRGMPLAEFRRQGESFAAVIDRMARPSTLAALRAAVAGGETTAIVSASLGDWIRPWAARRGVTAVIATEPETDSEGRLTGRFATPNCERRQKVERTLATFPELRDHRSDCFVTAYGDSPGDADMLEFANKPVWVTPNN